MIFPKYKCKRCGSCLQTVVANMDKSRCYAIERCGNCDVTYHWEVVDGKEIYFAEKKGAGGRCE